MTAKADEPRVLIKVPESFRSRMRQRAKQNDSTMIAELLKLENKAGGSCQANTPTATPTGGT